MIIVLLLAWVVFFVAKSSVQTMARLRPVVASPPAEAPVRR